MRVVGIVGETPAQPAGGSFVIMPLLGLPGPAGAPVPNLLLATGSAIDHARLTAVADRVMPRSVTTFRTGVLGSLASSPLQHGAGLLITLTIATAAALGLFGALQRANTELGVTVLIVTHDPAVSSVVRRVVAIRDGRTSTETHRHATTTDDGEVAHHAVEYAVLDRAGRLQLPREMTEPLGMRDLVRLESEPDHIGVWPDRREPS